MDKPNYLFIAPTEAAPQFFYPMNKPLVFIYLTSNLCTSKASPPLNFLFDG